MKLEIMKLEGRRKPMGQEGISLIEVLITVIVLGIAIAGIAQLLSRGQAYVVNQGDTRVALHLAEQKIERVRALGFSAAKLGNQVNTGCTDPTANNEPCYNETLSAGAGQQTPSRTQVDTQSFTRLTCVRWVQDDNPELPADPLEPPSSWTCPSCDTTQANCTKNTKRVKVAVISTTMIGAGNASTAVDPNRVTLETVLTPIPRP